MIREQKKTRSENNLRTSSRLCYSERISEKLEESLQIITLQKSKITGLQRHSGLLLLHLTRLHFCV